MPGVSNSSCAEPPGATSPVSNEPSVAVTVCACAPRFTHLIDWPADTLTAKPHELMSEMLPSTMAIGDALGASSLTTTVPFIQGCGVQMYAKIPGASNWIVAEAPGATIPLSNDPSLAVTLWPWLP